MVGEEGGSWAGAPADLSTVSPGNWFDLPGYSLAQHTASPAEMAFAEAFSSPSESVPSDVEPRGHSHGRPSHGPRRQELDLAGRVPRSLIGRYFRAYADALGLPRANVTPSAAPGSSWTFQVSDRNDHSAGTPSSGGSTTDCSSRGSSDGSSHNERPRSEELRGLLAGWVTKVELVAPQIDANDGGGGSASRGSADAARLREWEVTIALPRPPPVCSGKEYGTAPRSCSSRPAVPLLAEKEAPPPALPPAPELVVVRARSVVLATGSAGRPRRLGAAGEDEAVSAPLGDQEGDQLRVPRTISDEARGSAPRAHPWVVYRVEDITLGADCHSDAMAETTETAGTAETTERNEKNRSVKMGSSEGDTSSERTQDALAAVSVGPLLVIGAGLSAADAVLRSLARGVPVVHAFRARDPQRTRVGSKFGGNRGGALYDDLGRLIDLMEGKKGAQPAGSTTYRALAGATAAAFDRVSGMVTFDVAASGGSGGAHHSPSETQRVTISARQVAVLIGSDPDLSFLPSMISGDLGNSTTSAARSRRSVIPGYADSYSDEDGVVGGGVSGGSGLGGCFRAGVEAEAHVPRSWAAGGAGAGVGEGLKEPGGGGRGGRAQARGGDGSFGGVKPTHPCFVDVDLATMRVEQRHKLRRGAPLGALPNGLPEGLPSGLKDNLKGGLQGCEEGGGSGRLYAVGPLRGDNFVRFIVADAFAVVAALTAK